MTHTNVSKKAADARAVNDSESSGGDWYALPSMRKAVARNTPPIIILSPISASSGCDVDIVYKACVRMCASASAFVCVSNQTNSLHNKHNCQHGFAPPPPFFLLKKSRFAATPPYEGSSGSSLKLSTGRIAFLPLLLLLVLLLPILAIIHTFRPSF